MLEAPRNMIGLLGQLEQEAREKPDDIQLMQRLARLYLKNDAIEDSTRIYENILKLEPENAMVMAELANCRIRQQQFEEASFLLERAQEIRPGYYAVFLTFARLFEARRDTSQQVRFMMLAANAAPEKAEIRLTLADLLKRHGDVSGAITQYKILIEENPGLEAALFALGTLLMHRSELNEAMKCFRRILNNNPGAFDAHFNLANCLFRQKKFQMAITHFRFATRSKHLVERSLYLSAQCYSNLNDFDRAIVAMEKLVSHDENNVAYQKSLAETYLLAGEYDLARDTLRFLTRIAPERPEFMVKHAETLVLMKDFEMAEKALDTLFRQHPGHLEGHRLLGEVYLQRGMYKAAIEEFRRTLMINEKYARVYVSLARAFAELGDSDNEYASLNKACELGIEEPRILLKLGQLENRLKLPTSLDRFRRITEIAPDSDVALEAQYYLKHQAA